VGNHVYSLRFFYVVRSYARFESTVRSQARNSSLKPMVIFGSKAGTGRDRGVFKVMIHRMISLWTASTTLEEDIGENSY
jgi:hypothetical protein